jgi:hypothetical protein
MLTIVPIVAAIYISFVIRLNVIIRGYIVSGKMAKGLKAWSLTVLDLCNQISRAAFPVTR